MKEHCSQALVSVFLIRLMPTSEAVQTRCGQHLGRSLPGLCCAFLFITPQTNRAFLATVDGTHDCQN